LSPQASAEQRRETREDLHPGQLLVVDLISESPALRTHGVVLNISHGGMAVQTLRPLQSAPQSEIAEVNLVFSDASGSTCKGRLAWEKPGGVTGIRFLDTPLKTLPRLPERPESLPQNPSSAVPLAACLGEHRAEHAVSEFDHALHLLACSAMALTSATGAAIAIGNRNGMECRASIGSAPAVGTRLSPESGISGQSLRTGAIVLCNDALSDPRVHPAARQSDLRSIMIVPVLSGNDVIGLTEAFSQEVDHFDEHHLQRLRPLLNVLADAIKDDAGPAQHTSEQGVIAAPAIVGPPGVAAVGARDYAAAVGLRDNATAEPHGFHPADSGAYVRLAYSRLKSQPRTAMLLMIALALFVLAMAWLTYRHRAAVTPVASQQLNSQNAPQSAASTARPEIGFSPPLIDEPLGKTFGVDVVMKGARNLWSAPMQILYDPQQLQVITVTSGSLFYRDGQAATFVQRVNSSLGRIDVSLSRPLSSPGISGDGVVFTIVFLSKAKGNSKLRIDQTGLRDTATKALAANSSEAVVTISSADPSRNISGEQSATEISQLPPPATHLAQSSESGEATPGESAERVQDQGEVPPAMAGLATANAAKPPASQSPAPADTLRLPVQQPPSIADLKIPTIDATIALAPRASPVPTFVLERTLQGHTNWVTTVAFSANGQRLLTGSWDKSLKMWDVATGRTLTTIANKGSGLQTSALSHNGALIAAEDANNNLRLWNSATGEEIRTIKCERSPWDKSWVYSIAFSPNDQMLAAALNSSTVRLWDVRSGRTVRDFRGSSRAVNYVAFSSNGQLLATGGGPKTIDLWDVRTGALVRTFRGHRQDIYSVAFSPNGQWLASAGKDKTVKLWEVSSGREVHTLTGHQGYVTSLAFSLNGRWLASGSWDKTIKIWDVENGREVQTLTGKTNQIYSLAFDSRRGWLATGSEGGAIILWRLSKETNLALLDEQNGTSSSAAVASTGHAQ
jgi:WD40 repeat protein